MAGSGDKGRDIVAWKDPEGADPRHWDCYQCKHSKDPLAPSEIYVELGKLCYYTWSGEYSVTDTYYFVPSSGIGPKLALLIEKPEALRSELIANWEKHCRTEVKKGVVELEGALRTYVESFDFSIVQSIAPEEMLAQHAQTRYHAVVFGMAIKDRPAPDKPPGIVQPHETRYVEQLFEAFSDNVGQPITDMGGLSRPRHRKVFHQSREAFYCAESLQRFARETLPPDAPFEAILDELEEGLGPALDDPTHADGLARMIATTKHATQLQMSAHLLNDIVRPKDRIGMCHQLANADRVTWVPTGEDDGE